jgi:hypothetical protein
MLSAAKHLAVHRARPFAALRVTTRGSSQILRFAQDDTGRQLRLMFIEADKSALGTINRPLLMVGVV